MLSNSEWTCRSAAMTLVLAEQCGQRPEKISVDPENEDNPYCLQRRIDHWGTPRMQRCYRVGIELIPLLAESEPFSNSVEDVVISSWNNLYEMNLVEDELGYEFADDEFIEVASLTDEIVALFNETSEGIEDIANILATKRQLQYREIDEVLGEYGLVFQG